MREPTAHIASAVLGAVLAFAPAALPPSSAAGEASGLVRLTDRAWAWIAPDESSANGALLVGASAALLVDPGASPESAREFLTAAKQVTDRPIRWVVLTHWAPAHALGALCLEERSFELVAHVLTRRALAERGAAFRDERAASSRDEAERDGWGRCRLTLPDRGIEGREVLDLGGHAVEVSPVVADGRSGDLVVWSADESVLVAGDLYWSDACPSLGERSVASRVRSLAALERKLPRYVVPGRFAVGSLVGMTRFRAYLETQMFYAKECLTAERSLAEVRAGALFPRFESFQESPRQGATFADNAEAVFRELTGIPSPPEDAGGFEVQAVLDVGEAPHQIAFSRDGAHAYVAVAGSDRVTVVDVSSLEVAGELSVEGTPVGVVERSADALAVTNFRRARIREVALDGSGSLRELVTGEGPSLFVPLSGSRFLVSAEGAGRLWVFDAAGFELVHEYPTGRRPFPAAVTADGRKAFVPNLVDGTVTVIDLWNERVLETVKVGARPSGAAALPGGVEVAVAVRALHHIAFLNTVSHEVTGRLREGIGDAPGSVLTAPDGRHVFVNNTKSHDVSVIDLSESRVVARVPVGRSPVAMAVHEGTSTLWVSCEGSHEVHVIGIPARDPGPEEMPDDAITEVAVLGTTHGEHLTSETWGLEQLQATIERFRPDVVCAEIPPDRWDRIWSDFAERGVVEDERLKRFPEYTEVLLPLKIELGFDVEPCAAWSQEMSDLRREKIRQFEELEEHAERRSAYEEENAAIEARHAADPLDEDDPRVIHSEPFDRRTEEELGPYDAYLNEWIGPGGWTNINESHYRLIDAAIAGHRGRRILITFGSGHKHWFLRELTKRDDVRLVDIAPYLPGGAKHERGR